MQTSGPRTSFGPDTTESVIKRRASRKTIGFQTIDCLRCGGSRVLGQPCPECGAKAPSGEVNALLVKRRTAVRRIEEELAALDTVDLDREDLPSEEEVARYVHDFIDALGGFLEDVDSSQAAARLTAAEWFLRSLAVRCEQLPERRPTIARHRAMRRCMATLTRLWPKYAEALRAPDLADARRYADEGQDLIDSAVAELENLERLVDANRAYEDLSIPDFLDRTLHALSISHPNLSLLDLVELGTSEASGVTSVPVDGAHGPQFLVLSAIASTHFDEDRFKSILSDSARLCINSPHLRTVASEPLALESLATSARLLWESLASFEATLLRENDEQALMRRVIKFYGEFYEDVAGPIFVWYNRISGIKSQPFGKLAESDVQALAKNLVRHPTTEAYLEDSGAGLRNAAQHGNSYSITSGSIIFKLRTFSETLSYADVIDKVFSLLESVSAMSWSLSNALAKSGFDLLIEEADTSYMNLSKFRLAVLWLNSTRGNVLDATKTDAAWEFILEDNENQELEIAQTLMRGAQELTSEVTVRSSALAPHLRVPYSAFENLSTAQSVSRPTETLMAIIEFRHASRLDQKQVLDVSDLKFAAATVGMFILLNEENSLIPHLRRILEISRMLAVGEVVSVIRKVFIQTRNPEAAVKRQVATTLNAWLKEGSAPVVPKSKHVTVHK